MLQVSDCLGQARNLRGRETVLVRFPADVDFKENNSGALLFPCFLVQGIQQSNAVHGVNQMNQRKSGFDLIAL